MAVTEYVILRQTEVGTWSEDIRVSAPSAEEAVRKLAQDGTFVPVPVRSWNVFTVEAVTEPRLRVRRTE